MNQPNLTRRKYLRRLFISFGALTVANLPVLNTPARAQRMATEIQSYVRLLHAMPRGPKVDVYIDGAKKFNDADFGSLSKYIALPAGYHSFSIVTNAEPKQPERTLLSRARTLRGGSYYTVGPYGVKEQPKLLAFSDSSGGLQADTARLTLFHLSPGAPPFDVYAVTQTGRTYRLATRLKYGQIRAIYVPPVPMTIRFMVGRSVYKTVTDVAPRAATKYDIFALGRVGQNFRVVMEDAAR